MRLRKLRAHHWVVIAWIGVHVAAGASTRDVTSGLWVMVVFGLTLSTLSWEYSRKRDRSGDPDTYRLADFVRDTRNHGGRAPAFTFRWRSTSEGAGQHHIKDATGPSGNRRNSSTMR